MLLQATGKGVNVDIRQLSYFLTIAETGGFNAAARKRRVSQSALSRQMNLLEDELGVALFERKARGVTLTTEGSALYVRAQPILRSFDTLKLDVVGDLQTPSGELALGIAPSVCTTLGGPLIERFHKAFPRVRLKLIEGTSHDLATRLLSGQLDLALYIELKQLPGITFEPLAHEPLMLACPAKEGADASDVSIDIVPQLDVIATGRPNVLRMVVEEMLAPLGINFEPIMEVETKAMSLELLRRGIGHLLLPYCALRETVEAGEAVARRIKGSQVTWVVARPSERPISIACQKMTQLIYELSAELIESGEWVNARLVRPS